MQAPSAKAVSSKEIGEKDIANNVHVAPGRRDRYAPRAAFVIPPDGTRGCCGRPPPPRDQMRHLLRLLPFLALAGCAASLSAGQRRGLAAGTIGCERAEHGTQARAIAIYTRVVTEKVCVLDAAGQCHPRVIGGTPSVEIRLPQTSNAPPADAIRQELGRRGILARIARPRGPKMYASLGAQERKNGLLILELSEIGISDDDDVAHVMVRASGMIDASDSRAVPGGELVRLVRTYDIGDGGLSRRLTSPARACWRLERSTSSALAE
jgi:hypothetical protein